MSEDLLGYNVMVENAMRVVVREALERANKDGLPGKHHFYITFMTNYPGVKIPLYLKERYPEEMTIVIQNQFWNLATSDSEFRVELAFNGKPEKLTIPFAALMTFADPSVNFGLQFHVGPHENTKDNKEKDPHENIPRLKSPDGVNDKPNLIKAVKLHQPETKENENNVLSLDSFRKKSEPTKD